MYNTAILNTAELLSRFMLVSMNFTNFQKYEFTALKKIQNVDSKSTKLIQLNVCINV